MSICFSDLKPWTFVQYQALSQTPALRQRPEQDLACHQDQSAPTESGKNVLQNDIRVRMKKIPDTPNRWPGVSTVIDPATDRGTRKAGEKRGTNQQSDEDRSLTFLLSFVLLGFFLLFGYRLRQFPVTWKRTRWWKTMRWSESKKNKCWWWIISNATQCWFQGCVKLMCVTGAFAMYVILGYFILKI